MDLTRLTKNQRVVVTGAVLAAISLFLPWRGVATGSVPAFDSGLLAWGGLLVEIAGAIILVLKAMEIADITAASLSAEQLALVLPVIGLAMIIIRWIIGDQTTFGLYVGLVSAVTVIYGAFLSLRDAGLTVPTLRDFRSGRIR